MKTFILTSNKLNSVGAHSYSVSFSLAERTPEKTVEARNVGELVPMLDAWERELQATGKPWMASVRIGRGQRKPPGFDRETERGGLLAPRFVNPDKCTEKAFA